jgi:transposase InsO family protein
MDFSHSSAASPSTLFAVVAVALIHRVRPDWIAIGVTEAAQAEGLNPERISRLASRVIGLWLAILDTHSRRGRPTHQPDQDDELGTLRALLAVATTLLAQINFRRPALRPLVVGAWLRLRTELSNLTQERFCETLALPTRTLRSWLEHHPSATEPLPEPEQPPVPSGPRKRSAKPRKPRRPRFGFDLVIPGTQIGADTTDLSVLGVPLKLVAAQDIGGRDQNLFDAVIVDDHESSQHVIDVFTAAIAGREGMQAITDQGTPFMAKATRDALDHLGAEHAPQREGDPPGKATVERGFGILKTIAAPLFALSDRIAAVMPILRNTELAKGLGHLQIAALLRAYQAGARAARLASEQRAGLDESTLDRAAARARQAAHAEENSRRLLLAHLHNIYRFELPLMKFIHEYRRYPLSVLQHAERQLRSQLHRTDICSLTRYFGAIVRNEMDAYRSSKARRDRLEQQCNTSDAQAEEHSRLRRTRLADPVAWLRESISGLVSQWQPREQQLLFGGVGAALGWMQAALRMIATVNGHAALVDIANGVMNECANSHFATLGQPGVDAVRTILSREISAITPPTPNPACNQPSPLGTLWNTGRTKRPPAPNPLPI